MEEPTKSLFVESYEEATTAYAEAFREMNSSRFIRSSWIDRSEQDQTEAIAEIAEEITRKFEAVAKVKELFEHLQSPLMKVAEAEFLEWRSAMWRYAEYKQNLANFEADPSKYTLEAVAEAIVIWETLERAGKKRSGNPYWWQLDVLASVRGVDRQTIEAEARALIESLGMHYAISTKRISYSKKVA